MSFGEDAVKRSVFVHVGATYSGSGVLVYDLEPPDPEANAAFVEVDVEMQETRPFRKHSSSLRRIQLGVTVHCWQSPSGDVFDASEMADAVVSALRHKTIDVVDYATSEDPVGSCRFHEPTVDDRTQDIADDFRSDWRLVVVTCSGEAQET